MRNVYLIDIGSSTIKVYIKVENSLCILESKTFNFKKGFSPINGLSPENSELFYGYLMDLVDRYKLTNANCKLYATGIFREIQNPRQLAFEVFKRTGLSFNIVSHELEAFFLEKAWFNRALSADKNILVINIGGKTTEIVRCINGKIIRPNLTISSLGVGLMDEIAPKINDTYSPYSLKSVVDRILELLMDALGKPNPDVKYDFAIYTGGELNYMKCAHYPIVVNSLFSDINHPSMISSTDYFSKNEEIFGRISIDELRSYMPDNPSWMNGARFCSAIAQAICTYFNIHTIVPSDTNMIDGVCIQEARTVAICGSYNKYREPIFRIASKLRDRGYDVLTQKNGKVIGREGDFVIFEGDIIEHQNTWPPEKEHLAAIRNSDLVICCNYDNHIGNTTTFEIDYAYRYGKRIVFIEDNSSARTFQDRFDAIDFTYEVGLLADI